MSVSINKEKSQSRTCVLQEAPVASLAQFLAICRSNVPQITRDVSEILKRNHKF